MLFLGLAENLGKLILINLLKDIGKNFFHHNGDKNHKVEGKFLKVLNDKLLLSKINKTTPKKQIKLSLLLKELKLKIKNNPNLSDEVKEKLLKKLDKIQKLIKEKEHFEYAELGIDSEFISKDFPTFNVDVVFRERLKREIDDIKLALKDNKDLKIARRNFKFQIHPNHKSTKEVVNTEKQISQRKNNYLKEIEVLLKKGKGEIEWKNRGLQSKIAENKIKFQHNLIRNNNSKDEKSDLISFSQTLIKTTQQQKIQIKAEPIDFQTKILNQIKKGIIQNNIKNEISIKLHPPELGKVHIKLAMINNELTAKVITQHSDVKQVILNNLNTLQEALKEKGINLSNFQVSVQGEFAQSYDGNKNGNYSKKDNRKFTFSSIEEENNEVKEIFYLISELENKLNLKI